MPRAAPPPSYSRPSDRCVCRASIPRSPAPLPPPSSLPQDCRHWPPSALHYRSRAHRHGRRRGRRTDRWSGKVRFSAVCLGTPCCRFCCHVPRRLSPASALPTNLQRELVRTLRDATSP
jgi:hypothetical protein